MFREFTKYFEGGQGSQSKEMKETTKANLDDSKITQTKPLSSKISHKGLTGKPRLNLRGKGLGSNDASICDEETSKQCSPKVKVPIEAIPEKGIKTKQTPFFPDKQSFGINRSLSPVFQFSGLKKKAEQTSFKLGEDRKKSLAGISQHMKNALVEKPKMTLQPSKSSITETKQQTYGLELLEEVKRSNFNGVLNILSKLDEPAQSVNVRGEYDWTPMHFACWTGHMNILNLLYYNQADINAVAKGGITPLMVCCLKGNNKLAKHLVSLRANLELTDDKGNTALHFAVRSGSLECLQALLECQSVDIFSKNSEGKAAIDLARTSEMKDLILKVSSASEEKSYARCIQITSVKNENFFTISRDNGLIRTSDTDSSGRSRELDELGPKDFVIHAQIGKGSFGEVFLVERKATGALYAMKVLYKSTIKRILLSIRTKSAQVCSSRTKRTDPDEGSSIHCHASLCFSNL